MSASDAPLIQTFQSWSLAVAVPMVMTRSLPVIVKWLTRATAQNAEEHSDPNSALVFMLLSMAKKPRKLAACHIFGVLRTCVKCTTAQQLQQTADVVMPAVVNSVMCSVIA
ncbi:hypothetical protein CPC08DRAFT_728943 [Agrocybe pediades]|nr:hypothetical protein CPC08DRAFT_728943 [Agrocybe pediades]